MVRGVRTDLPQTNGKRSFIERFACLVPLSVVQRQALRTNVHSVENGSTGLWRSVHSLPRVPWRTRFEERLGSAPSGVRE
jgi:hypothetical protein